MIPHRESGLDIKNPGEAYITRIWKVARATAAAPGFFSKMSLDGKRIQSLRRSINHLDHFVYRKYICRWKHGAQ